jgi:hypothetical protein
MSRSNPSKARRANVRPARAGFRPRPEPLEDRLAPDATPVQIAQALDLPVGTAVTYSGDPRAVAVQTRPATGQLLGFPSGRDEAFLVLSTGVAADLGGSGTVLTPGTNDPAAIGFTVAVPTSSNPQKLDMDYRFLTNESPTSGTPAGGAGGYLGQDTFSGTATIQDGSGSPIVEGFFVPAVAPQDTTGPAPGIPFSRSADARTVELVIPQGVGSVAVHLEIHDGTTDDGIDSSVLLDNVRFVSRQVVYLDFGGGTLPSFGATDPFTSLVVPAFAPDDVGMGGVPTATVIDQIAAGVRTRFQDFDITFVTTPPASGDYMHVVIGGGVLTVQAVTDSGGTSLPLGTLKQYQQLHPELDSGYVGYSTNVDIGNRIQGDTALILSHDIRTQTSPTPTDTPIDVLENTIAHEIGHNLGLKHEVPDAKSIMSNGAGPTVFANSSFEDNLNALPQDEIGEFKDGATRQNAHAYLMSVLGPSYDPTATFPIPSPLLQPPAPPLLDLGLNLEALPGPVYGLRFGLAVPGGTLRGGGGSATLSPRLLATSGGPVVVRVMVPNVYTSPSVFFYGSTTPGGPIDVVSGAPGSGGPGSAGTYVPLFDASGNLNTNIPVSVGTPGQLQPFGTAALRPAAVGRPPALAVGGGPGGAAQVYTPAGGGQYSSTAAATLTPFPGFTGDIRAATGDVNGDGVPDTVLVTGPGTRTMMAVVSGADGSVLLGPTDPFGDANFTFGGFVTAGDIDGDGKAEWVVTPELRGGPRVVIFRLDPAAPGGLDVVANFFGIQDDTFRDGARAALGDVNGDGILDVFAIAAFNGGPRTALFDGKDVLVATGQNRAPKKLVGDFFAAPSGADEGRGGRSIAVGDVNGDGVADLIVTGDNLLGTGNQVVIFSGADLIAGRVPGLGATPLANFAVSGQDPGALISVAAVNADGDAKADLAVGSGAGQPSLVKVYLGKNVSGTTEPASTSFDPFGTVTTNGVFVG